MGSPFVVGPPPIVLHDASTNAQFNLVPRTSVIGDGGTVTFTIGGPTARVPHQVAVCEFGMTPDDVNVAANGTPLINDSRCPVAGPKPAPLLSAQVPVTFSEPGRYLVLCNIRGHFANFNMYGWVTVK